MGEGNIIRLNMFSEAVDEHLCDVKSNISIRGGGHYVFLYLTLQNDLHPGLKVPSSDPYLLHLAVTLLSKPLLFLTAACKVIPAPEMFAFLQPSNNTSICK